MKYNRPIGYVSLMLFGVALLCVMIGQLWAKRHVADLLSERIPAHLKLDYSDLQVNILMGNMQIDNVYVVFIGRDTASARSKLTTDILRVEGISLWKYLINKAVDIDKVLLENPRLVHDLTSNQTMENSPSKGFQKFDKSIAIRNLRIKDGSVGVTQDKLDRPKLEVGTVDISLTDIKIDSNTLTNTLPFTYDEITLRAESILLDMGPYETIKANAISLEDHILRIKKIVMRSEYEKRELSEKLTRERDHIALEIPEIMLDSIDFGFKAGRFFVAANQGVIERPKLEIYRDKLIDDDLTRKQLYSQMLRELPMDLTVPKLLIRDGHLGYEELVYEDTEAGRIFFDQIGAELQNVSNTYAGNEKTRIKVDALFMEMAPLTLDLSFDVNSLNDNFLASGKIVDLQAGYINSFLESNMRSRAIGRAEEIVFTISGNTANSMGDMKMKYNDFEFVILKKNRLDINRVLTAAGNLFVKTAEPDEYGYRHGKIEAERDPTKSFFSYLWINVRNGLRSTLTGGGEKE